MRGDLPAPLRDLIGSAVNERPDGLSARARTVLRLGTRSDPRQRFGLATLSFVLGIAVFGGWLLLAWTLILVGSMPFR